ncbi:Leucine-rich repeat protein [Handroanthus impetiginosus]|uniref:Leucine-rich repeat protein n=1 Tax=Handroanthus impetiginosus TaxID=429701 RepID=A0A2G9GVC6_9LAMI|nr:Leucine-rich repeat protein [Handroanthus impetiginosus]
MVLLSSTIHLTPAPAPKMIISTNSLTCLKVSVFLILLTIHVEAYSSFVNNGSIKCQKRERLALLKFKVALMDPNGYLSTWRNEEGEGKDCCKWKGVLCDNRTNHVVELDLLGMDLEGKISPSLLELSNLNYLDLSFNNFYKAQIPEFIGSLGKLQHLSLSCSKFSGLIPHSLGNLSNLRFLELSLNDGLDKNLDWLSSLQALEYLELDHSSFDAGFDARIPEVIGSLGKLHHLSLWQCNFSGLILHPLGNLSNLRFLFLSDNYGLDKNLDWLAGLQALEYLDLTCSSYDAFFDAHIPKFIGSLGKLQHLSVSYCNFSGLILHPLGNLSNLRFLDLSVKDGLYKNLDWLSGLQALEYLDLICSSYDAGFDAHILEFIGSLGKLQNLSLSSCNFSGLILHPQGNLSNLRFLSIIGNYGLDKNLGWLSGFQSLEYLDLSYTEVPKAATWPQALHKLTALKEIYLVSCGLSTNMVNSLVLANVSASLVLLDLSYNYLDRIPHAIGNLISLSHLDLSNNLLQGEFPNSLGNLSRLSYLVFSNNELQGEFPRSSNLQLLDVSENKFSGLVPDLSSWFSLRWLSLRNNLFNGTLTESIWYPPNVEHLDLGSNHLEGLISEAHLVNLSKLRALDLSFNSNFTINISPSWNPSFQLSSLTLARCILGPRFPKWLQKQKELEVLDISDAKISDSIPNWFWDNSQMISRLNMSHNHIYGVLPDLSSKIHLQTIDLSSNELSGSLPLPPPRVNEVYLSRNKFSGTIINVCNFRILFALDLSDNIFSIEISQDCFTHLMRLSYLNLANNNFSGEIPNSIDWLCFLSSLHLRNNSFTGKFSRSLKNCSMLTILDLGENKFIGTIPSWLGESMPNLHVLSLKSNKLYGVLPSTLCHLAKLQVLDISGNKISGAIPKCVKNFTVLSSKSNYSLYSWFIIEGNATESLYDSASVMWKGRMAEYVNALRLLTLIDLSGNSLTGEIPAEIGSLLGLFALNLSRNNLVGTIPHDIGRLELLNFLDLSKNNLSGSIPPTLSQLSHLGILDLSFNNLSGRIPWDTHMQTFDAPTYMGNPGLCGPPLVFKPCPEDEMPEKPRSTNNVDEVHENKFITRGFYISMAVGFIVAFWGVCGTLLCNKWCWIIVLKMFIKVEDWFYVNMLVNKNRIQRHFEQHEGISI